MGHYPACLALLERCQGLEQGKYEIWCCIIMQLRKSPTNVDPAQARSCFSRLAKRSFRAWRSSDKDVLGPPLQAPILKTVNLTVRGFCFSLAPSESRPKNRLLASSRLRPGCTWPLVFAFLPAFLDCPAPHLG